MVLPLLRRPFVPAALVAGAMAPDLPYFLGILGLAETSAQDWYGPLLPNATQTHSLWGLVVNLPFAVGLVAVYRMLRAPVTALLPTGFRLPEPERATGWRANARYTMWLVASALIGVASHLAWDSLTVSPLLQNASTALGLAAIGWYLWRHRGRLRTQDGTVARLGPAARWSVVALLVAAPALGIAVNAGDDYNALRYVTEVDYNHPTTVDLGHGVSETTYPTTTVPSPWGTLAEGMVTGAAKRAGALFLVALVLYAAAWHIAAVARRSKTASDSTPSSQPTPDREATPPTSR